MYISYTIYPQKQFSTGLFTRFFGLFLLLWCCLLQVSAQQAQLSFTLTANETGVTRDYKARESIILRPGFRYSATSGLSFKARISIQDTIYLSNGNVLFPDGTQLTPDLTQIAVDGTQTKADSTIISPEGTVFKTNGKVMNPDGTLLNLSYTVPELWFKTVALSADANSRYRWRDYSQNNVILQRYVANGTGTEYTVSKDSVHFYNSNPAIDLTAGNISKEIKLNSTNLAQATIIGIWGTKPESTNNDRFIFAVNGRLNESTLFSKANIHHSVESGKTALAYGSDQLKNLLTLPGTSPKAILDRETALRIASYYKSNMPNTSLWGEPAKATLSMGANFQQSNTNNSSTFSASLQNFEGFKGYSPELLIFPRALQPVERAIYESYLAIKYGVSLDKSYYSAQGKICWNHTTNSSYQNRIAGYGRENQLLFNQKLAASSYQQAPYFSDISTNRLMVFGAVADTLKNGQYVLMGDNNLALTATDETQVGYVLMPRKWKVAVTMPDTTKTVANWVEISYLDSMANGFAARKYDTYLLITRNTQTIEYKVSSVDEVRSKIIFNNVGFRNGDILSFGYKKPQTAPKNHWVDDAEYGFVNDIKVYYKDPSDKSNVTVRVLTARPSTALVTLYDMSGRTMQRITLPEGCDARYADLHIEMKGIFIVKVLTNDQEYSKKIIVN